MLPAPAVGSDEYYIWLIQQCKQGCQTCFECPLVLCHDNNHAFRIQALEQAVLHFTYAVADLERRLARKDELYMSAKETTIRLQASVEEHRDRLKHLKEAIRINQEDANKKGEFWEELDCSARHELGELEHYIDGLQTALRIMDYGHGKE